MTSTFSIAVTFIGEPIGDFVVEDRSGPEARPVVTL
jgi:hypothetical protein